MLNEESTIGSVVRQAREKGYTCICVDDCSNDLSPRNARDEGAIVVQHALNLGQGAALETGFEFVRKFLPNAKYVFTFDADEQHSIDDVGAAITLFESNSEIDVVLGSRFLESGFQGTIVKKIVLQGMARFSLLSMGLRITDRHNGFRGFRRSVLKHFRISNPGFGHADEILRILKMSHLRYAEVQTHIKYTPYSISKGQRLINGFRLVFDRFLGAK
jgi:glycosyltransferase involved in cell wall biosynthesis